MSTTSMGPWFIRYCDDDSHMCMTVISSTDHGPTNNSQFDDEADTVAIVFHQQRPAVNAESDDFGAPHASLIAAAPDLFAALEFLMEHIDEPPKRNCSCHISPPCNDCVDYFGLREAFSMARAALAKAGGRSA